MLFHIFPEKASLKFGLKQEPLCQAQVFISHLHLCCVHLHTPQNTEVPLAPGRHPPQGARTPVGPQRAAAPGERAPHTARSRSRERKKQPGRGPRRAKPKKPWRERLKRRARRPRKEKRPKKNATKPPKRLPSKRPRRRKNGGAHAKRKKPLPSGSTKDTRKRRPRPEPCTKLRQKAKPPRRQNGTATTGDTGNSAAWCRRSSCPKQKITRETWTRPRRRTSSTDRKDERPCDRPTSKTEPAAARGISNARPSIP